MEDDAELDDAAMIESQLGSMSAAGAAAASAAGGRTGGGTARAARSHTEKQSAILRALDSLDPNERLSATVSIASIVSTGTHSEQAAKARQLIAEGVLKRLLPRLLEDDARMRMHSIGALRNLALAGDEEVVNAILDADMVAIVMQVAAAAANTVPEAVTGRGGAGLLEALCSECLALLTVACEVSEAALPRLVPQGCLLAMKVLDVDPATPRTVSIASSPRVRFAAMKLLHVLSDGNASLNAVVRADDSASSLLLRLASSAPEVEHPLTSMHALAALSNVYLQPIVGADSAAASVPRAGAEAVLNRALDTVDGVLAWRPLSALAQVYTALNAGRAAYAAVRAVTEPAQRAQEVAEADRRAKARVRAKERRAAGRKSGMEEEDAEEEVVDPADGAAAAHPAILAHRAAIDTARAARGRYQHARREFFNDLRRVTLCLEVLANVVGGADEIMDASTAAALADSGAALDAIVPTQAAATAVRAALQPTNPLLMTADEVSRLVSAHITHRDILPRLYALLSAVVETLLLTVDSASSGADAALVVAQMVSLPTRFRHAAISGLFGVVGRAATCVSNFISGIADASLDDDGSATVGPDAFAAVSNVAGSVWSSVAHISTILRGVHGAAADARRSVWTAPPSHASNPDAAAVLAAAQTADAASIAGVGADELINVIDTSLDDENNAAERDKMFEDVVEPAAARLASDPQGLDYGDDGLAGLALSAAQPENTSAAQLLEHAFAADASMCTALRVCALPPAASALMHCARLRRAATAPFAVAAADVQFVLDLLQHGLQLQPLDSPTILRDPGVLRVHAEARTQAAQIIGALASAASALSTDTVRVYHVDASVHAVLGSSLAGALAREGDVLVLAAAVDALMDAYGDEEHDATFAANRMLATCEDAAKRLQALLPEAKLDREDAAHVRGVRSNLLRFIAYKRSMMR